jgi:hypothetical protein
MEYWLFNEPLIINPSPGNDCLKSTNFLKKTMGNSTQSLKMQLSPTTVHPRATLEIDD